MIVLIVLKIIGFILLAVLALVLLLLTLVLTFPVRIEVKRLMPEGPFKVRVGFGFLRKTLSFQNKQGKKTKKKSKPKPKKTAEKKPKQKTEGSTTSSIAAVMKRIDMDKTVQLTLDLLDDMAGTITWERLYVTVILHERDAAQTGMTLGTLSAVIGNIYPYFAQAFVLKDPKIVIDADFDAEKTVWGIDISLMTRLIRFPRIIWRRKKQLWALWKSFRGK